VCAGVSKRMGGAENEWKKAGTRVGRQKWVGKVVNECVDLGVNKIGRKLVESVENK
jgi:hypothetical protein